MFEKEAEDNKPPYAFCAFNTKCELWKDGFQKGAEFGYKKANEWHEIENKVTPKRDMPKNKEMYEDLLERNKLQISELNTLTEEQDRHIVELEKENAELKEKLDKIRKYLVYDIFDRFKYLENLLKINQETQEELCKRIIEQQKTIGSLTDLIDELKAQCSVLADCNTCHSSCKNENAEMKEQLTKAKEIIQKLYNIVCGRSGDDWELIKQAEQFLREVEE